MKKAYKHVKILFKSFSNWLANALFTKKPYEYRIDLCPKVHDVFLNVIHISKNQKVASIGNIILVIVQHLVGE